MPVPPPPPATVWTIDVNGKTTQLGPLNVPAGSAIAPTLVIGGAYGAFLNPVIGTGIFAIPGYVFTTTGARRTFMIWDYGIKIPGTADLQWSDTDGIADKPEIGLALKRDENNKLSQRNGTNPQSYASYNTWTDGTHFERADLGWIGNTFVLSTGVGSEGGTPRDVALGAGGAEVVRFQPGQKLGFFTAPPVVKQLSAGVVNNVPASGTNDTFDDFADNDWTALRALCSQQSRKIKELSDLVRNYGLAG
jgi:hypothetical protein